MRSLLFLVAIGCLSSIALTEEPAYGSSEFLDREKDILLVHKYVHQGFWNADLFTLANQYSIKEDAQSYENQDHVTQFVELIENKQLLPRFALFSVYNVEHLRQARSLFNLFIGAKNYQTVSRLLSWARYNVNEKMFMYVVQLAVIHRRDIQTLIMPTPYEIDPYQYIDNDVIKEALRLHQLGFPDVEAVNGLKNVVLQMNYSHHEQLNDEQRVAYFTNDPAYNAHYYYFQLAYPHWLEGRPHGLDKDRRGELFIFVHQQMLARYHLERLSNDLGEIPEFHYRQPIKAGFNPSLGFFDGQQQPSRPNDFNLHTADQERVEAAETREQRIRNIIKQKFVESGGNNIPVANADDVNTLGNILQGNPDVLLENNAPIVPSFLENLQSAARDPLFYQYYKNVIENYYNFLKNVPHYSDEERGFSGVSINSVNVDNIETFFEHFNIDISNAIDVAKEPVHAVEGAVADFKPDEIFVEARTVRLNHKPFSYTVNIQSNEDRMGTVRVFLGPKSEGNFNKNRQNFVLFDAFITNLKAGENTVKRSSTESSLATNDQTTYYELYKRVLAGKSGERTWDAESLFRGPCEAPRHLQVPRGTTQGMTYQFFVTVNPAARANVPRGTHYNPSLTCGIGSGSRYSEDRPLLFPLDRELDAANFFTDNMATQDVVIRFNDGNGVQYV